MIRLRPYNHADFEDLYKLDQKCFDQGIAYSRAELSSYIERKGSFTIVAEVVPENAAPAPPGSGNPPKHKIAGFVTVTMDPKGFGHIITIDTHPDMRRKKLGTTLIEAAEKEVRERGGFMVVLEVAVNNLAAIKFYKLHRYATLRKLPLYYNGKTDGLFMSKRL